jgi:hypothetical protein
VGQHFAPVALAPVRSSLIPLRHQLKFQPKQALLTLLKPTARLPAVKGFNKD